MGKIFFVFSFLLLGTGFRCKEILPEIKNNQQYAGIVIGRSTFSDVKKVFGRKFQKHTHTWNLGLKGYSQDKVTLHVVRYPETGIYFSFYGDYLSNSVVSIITFTKPFDKKTDKGIEIGKSNFSEVISLYGEGRWNSGSIFYNKKLRVSYEGISFKTDKSMSLDSVESADKKQFQQMTITEIELKGINKVPY